MSPASFPPVPCPDCRAPLGVLDEGPVATFACPGCAGQFVFPHGWTVANYRELWSMWTAGKTLVELPKPVEQDGNEHVWHVADEQFIVASYMDRPGRPSVEVQDDIGDVLLGLDTTDMRALAAAMLAACDRADLSADLVAQAKQDAEESAS